MKKQGLVVIVCLILLLPAAELVAGHVVYLDFSNFNLNSWSSVNGNNPPTANDVTAVRRQVIANMAEDYATFDVTFTTKQPANGRYTWVKILGLDNGGLYGCAGPDCCPVGGDCTGIGTWDDMTVSACEVYSGSFSDQSSFTGTNATTARIANGISHTASHELGHVLGLSHCNAADDSMTLGCTDITLTTADQNVLWHTMASGTSWGLTSAQRATRDRFFSVHASRRRIASAVQLRNHFATLGNVNGGVGVSDLTYGRPLSPTSMQWYTRLSTGSSFGNYSTWSNDAGDAGDLFFTADVNNDKRDDLVYGKILSSTQVAWYVRLSNGSGFNNFTVWSTDAGDAGDIFRLADVNGDGRADLVYGRPLTATTVRWYVRLSTGTNFGPYSTWISDAGDVGDLFFLADVDADGDADLVYARAISSTQVKWWVRRSLRFAFGSAQVWREDAGDRGDLFYVGDLGGDGDADLLYGRVVSNGQVTWYVRPSTGSQFGSVSTWASDAGDAGDLFRIGDATGDGRVDLFYGRPLGMTSLTSTPNLGWVRWYGRASTGTSFAPYTTWANDAGDEGDYFP